MKLRPRHLSCSQDASSERQALLPPSKGISQTRTCLRKARRVLSAQVRLWDLAAGKCQAVLTNHKKSVRAVKLHPTEYSFVTCGADRLKVGPPSPWRVRGSLTSSGPPGTVGNGASGLALPCLFQVWRCPLGVFERNIDGHNAIPNCCTIRSEHDRSSLIVGTNNGCGKDAAE